MAFEKWYDRVKEGDLVRSDYVLDEIKLNMVNVIKDYAGSGIENEDELIEEANSLFTGDFVPSARDWDLIKHLLSELATVKELGKITNEFLKGINDTLGASDLIEIKDFIDYIQTLSPVTATLEVSLFDPKNYFLEKPIDSTTDNWDHATVSWELRNPPKTDRCVIEIIPSKSEDVKEYRLNINSGTFQKTVTLTNKDSLTHEFDAYFTQWYPLKDLDKVSVSVSVDVIDKRGNVTTSVHPPVSYPKSVQIQSGVSKYQLQYQKDGSAWKTIIETPNKTHKWDMPRENGTYRYRVSAIDKNGKGYGALGGNGQYTYAYSEPRYIQFIPDPPGRPVIDATSTWHTITAKWKQVARAEYYEVWHDGSHGSHKDKGLKWAKDNTTGKKVYYKKVLSTQKLEVEMMEFGENTKNPILVRAVNEGGSSDASKTVLTKKRTVRTNTYVSTGVRVWETGYARILQNKTRTTFKDRWIPADDLIQGEWVDADWNGGWACGRGDGYCAYGGQKWGNHMNFIFFDTLKMRADLGGTEVVSVEFEVTRRNTKGHGHSVATPLYIYGIKRWNNGSVSLSEDFNLYHHTNTLVNFKNQSPITNVKFDWGETEKFSNDKTKAYLNSILSGRYTGLGIAKYYGNTINSDGPIADVAFIRLKPVIKMRVTYKEK